MRRVLIVFALLAAGCGKAPTAVPAPASKAPAATAQAQGIFNQPVVIDAWLHENLTRYDHNRSGAVDLGKTGWFARDERTRQETVRREERDQAGKVVKLVYTTYVYTLRDLWYAADRNADQKATREEIAAVMATFDADKNGELSRRGLWGLVTFKPKGEYDKFRDAYGERVSDVERREVDVNDRAGQLAIEREAPLVDQPTRDAE